MADMTFEMFRFLMLDQDLLIVELTITVPNDKIVIINSVDLNQSFMSATYQHHGLDGFFFFRPIIDSDFYYILRMIMICKDGYSSVDPLQLIWI